MSAREKFIALLESQPLQKGDVIVVMQGDGLARVPHAVKLFKDGFAPRLALVGSANDRAYGSFPPGEVRDEVLRLGVPGQALHFEESGPNTRGEAERAMVLARAMGWKTILIVTSPHHQYRAFLTFLKAMQDAKMDCVLINAVAPLSWDEPAQRGVRRELLPQEFDRIEKYREKGDVASYDEGIAYLEKNV